MNLAPQELERNASQYAADAIKYDSQGARGMAIAHYEKAIQSLSKLMKLYPDSKLNNIYTSRLQSYQNRIKALQSLQGNDFEPAVDPNATPEEQQSNLGKARQDSFEEMIMKEKPNINWAVVVGVDVAINALREFIVWPTK